VNLTLILIWIIGLALLIRAAIFALAVPFLNWIKSEQDLTPKSSKEMMKYYLRYFDFVIAPITFIAMGVKYLFDLGSM
jgi:hypothetical protein